MATNKRARKPASEKASNSSQLLEALKFVAVSQHAQGTPLQTHCRIGNKTVIGFDGGITAGHFIDEILSCCPHTYTLLNALSKCADSISITDTDGGKLSVKSGKFRALVPCLPWEDLPAVEPDPRIATLTDAVKSALAAVLPVALDGSNVDAFKCAVLLCAGSAVATNGAVILEAWHGIDLPDVLIPKASAQAICKQTKPLTGFGFSANSATFYYEDNSFIKTQLFVDKYPGFQHILDVESNPWPLPGGFFEGVDIASSFSVNNVVYFRDGHICSHVHPAEGASYQVEGIPNDLAFNSIYLKIIREHCHKIQFNINNRGMALFFGDNVRGAIMKVNVTP